MYSTVRLRSHPALSAFASAKKPGGAVSCPQVLLAVYNLSFYVLVLINGVYLVTGACDPLHFHLAR